MCVRFYGVFLTIVKLNQTTYNKPLKQLLHAFGITQGRWTETLLASPVNWTLVVQSLESMPMIRMLHLVVGTAFLFIFLATGYYMSQNFPNLYQGREEIRMMYRATHIYILFAAATNLLVAHALNPFSNWLSKVQVVASLLLLVAPFLVFWGYIVEPPAYMVERPISFWGIVSLFFGIVLISLLNLPWVKRHST